MFQDSTRLKLLPESLMNLSGPSVAAALRSTVKFPKSMIVIQDSLLHDTEIISPKYGGSANGHNGIKSIISALRGDECFHRFRIGIGRSGNAAEFVLSKLSSHERQFWGKGGQGIDLVVKEIENIVRALPQ
jgi:PTH1 family peptidyl-tRNA hydrolase